MATQVGPAVQIAAHGLFEESTTQRHRLGELVTAGDGRAYRYCKAGATALVPGKLQQAAAEATNHQNVAPAAAAIGATSVTVTLGATAATANQYAEGFLAITVTPGQGYQYKIKSHPAADASATLVLTLEDPIEVALTTSSRCDLSTNPYSAVVVNPTTATSAAVGVAVNNIAASSFGWLQVRGPAVVLADGALTVGVNVSASNAVAGAVEAAVTAQAACGVCITGIADTEYGMVNLNIN